MSERDEVKNLDSQYNSKLMKAIRDRQQDSTLAKILLTARKDEKLAYGFSLLFASHYDGGN